MGVITSLPLYIAGESLDAQGESPTINSLDGSQTLRVRTTSAGELRRALRFAAQSQEYLATTTMAERIAVARLVMREYRHYAEEVVWGLGKFRGIVSGDCRWMIKLLGQWADELEAFVAAVWQLDQDFSRQIIQGRQRLAQLSYRSKGFAAFYSAATMDGPPLIAALCHGILSGTHLIVRPSWRDTVTHFMFALLDQHQLGRYAQLVRWPSVSPQSSSLNQQLIVHSPQAMIFCTDLSFARLAAEAGLTTVAAINAKMKKYGTGLPLVIVTEHCNLVEAAEKIVRGACLGNGKFCLSHGPVLVAQSVYSAFKQLVIALAEARRLEQGEESGKWDPEELPLLARQLARFGGTLAAGKIGVEHMDLLIVSEVSPHSPCLWEEFSGTYLALIAYQHAGEACAIAQRSLGHNQREAWTAVNVFGNAQEFREFAETIASYSFVAGGITAIPQFLLPHQGSYFALDLMRRHCQESQEHAG